MRLTLRTLLAYLDGILDSNDSQDLGKKIEESEYAVGLVHRIRDVMRRLRLGSPSLTDRGPGLDPNTVAEYLDNTLASDHVTDFEKVCLDSDVHLAEVAACHQILTLVLGEPAEVDPASRQRMYQIADTLGAAQGRGAAGGSRPPPMLPLPGTTVVSTDSPSLSLDLGESLDESGGRKLRQRPTVPEYLRERRRHRAWVPVVTTAVVAIALLAVVLKMFGQFEPGTPLGDVLVSWSLVESPELAKADQGDKLGGAAKGEGGESEAAGLAPRVTPTEHTAPSAGTATAPAPTGKPAQTPTKVEPPAPTASSPTVPVPVALPSPGGPAKESGTKTPPQPEPPPAPGPLPDVGNAKQPAIVPATPQSLGRLLSNDQVLLSNDSDGNWTRVAANDLLSPEPLVALPTYRPNVAFNGVVALEILGGTRLDLLGGALPGIHILDGRMVLRPLAKAGSQLRVTFGDHTGTLTFVGADATAAFDVRHIHAPGMNPETEPPSVTAELFVTTGAVVWQETVGGKALAPTALKAAQRVSFEAATTSPPVAIRETPVWVAGGEPIDSLDRLASPKIAQALGSDGPARVGLLELTTVPRPQKEVKRLALRCLGYVGQFRDMVAALDDPANRYEWDDYYIKPLRLAIARDPETAAAVRGALEKQYPQQAAELYRMLWGYTNDQLEGDREDANLVGALKSEVLAVRVLAYWNLRDITGVGEGYQPAALPAVRQQKMSRWEQRLKDKEIRFRSPDEKPRGARKASAVAPPAPGAGP
jgi:hypothetical protein